MCVEIGPKLWFGIDKKGVVLQLATFIRTSIQFTVFFAVNA